MLEATSHVIQNSKSWGAIWKHPISNQLHLELCSNSMPAGDSVFHCTVHPFSLSIAFQVNLLVSNVCICLWKCIAVYCSNKNYFLRTHWCHANITTLSYCDTQSRKHSPKKLLPLVWQYDWSLLSTSGKEKVRLCTWKLGGTGKSGMKCLKINAAL